MKDRLSYIDVFKGLGILIMLVGHLYGNTLCFAYINSFHMPLFFFISGLLLNTDKYQKFKSFLISRVKSLYVPFVLFYLILWVYWCFVERQFRTLQVPPVDAFLGLFWGSNNCYWIYPAGVLWFVAALFSLEIIIYSASKLSRNKCNIVLLIGFVLGVILAYHKLYIFPLGINNALISIPFMFAGLKLRKYIIIDNKLSCYKKMLIPMAIILFVLNLAACIVFGCEITVGYLNTGNLLFYLSIPFFGIFSWLFVSYYIGNNSIIQWLGRNSLVILAFHPPVSRALIFLAGKAFHITKYELRGDVIYTALLILATIALCIPLCILWNRIQPSIIKRIF